MSTRTPAGAHAVEAKGLARRAAVAAARLRLRRADEAEGAVAAAPDDDHDDVHRGRSLARARRAHVPRRLPLRGRRGRDQPLPRPRHRRADAQHREPTDPGGADRPVARRSPSAACSQRSRCSSSRSRSTRSPRGSRSRASSATSFVYTAVAQAPHAAEHRDRGRCGRRSAARRLGGRARQRQRHRRDPLLHRVLLDAAALLVALAADEGRLRARGRADAPRRRGRARDASARSCSTRCCSTWSRSCPSARARSARSTSRPRSLLGLGFIGGAVRLYRASESSTRRAALQLYLFSLAYLASLFAAMVDRREALSRPI